MSSSTTATDRGRPAQLDRALAQRILPRRGLVVALHLPERRLAHIHDRAPAPMRLGDLRRGHSSRSPSTSRASSRASRSVTASWRSGGSVSHTAAGTTASSLTAARAAPTSPTSVFNGGSPRGGRRARNPLSRPTSSRHAAGEADHAQRRLPPPRHGRSLQRAGIVPTLPSTSRQIRAVSPGSVRQPSTSQLDVPQLARRLTSRTRSGNGSTT